MSTNLASGRNFKMPEIKDYSSSDLSSFAQGEIDLIRSSQRTTRGGIKKTETYYIETAGTGSEWEIDTNLNRVTSGLAINAAGTNVAIVVKPKATAPNVAVVTGLAVSTIYLLTFYGD